MKFNNTKLSGYMFVSLGALLMAGADIVIKKLLNQGVQVVDLVAIRDLIGFLLLFLWTAVFAPEALKISKKDLPYFFIFGTIGVAALHFIGIWSVKINTVSTAIVLLYTSPIFIFIWTALIRREKLFLYEIIATVIVLTGIIVTFQFYRPDKFRTYWFGILVGIFSAIVFAFSTIWGKHGVKRYSTMTISVYGMGVASIFWLFTGFPFQFLTTKHNLWIWSSLILVAVLCTIFMPVLYILGLRTIRSAEANLTASLEQVFVMGLSYALLQERLDALQFCGLFLIIGGVVYLHIKGIRIMALFN
jgi:drug/metabolite transporter (DMT)-like permease